MVILKKSKAQVDGFSSLHAISSFTHPVHTGTNSTEYTFNHNLNTTDIELVLYGLQNVGGAKPIGIYDWHTSGSESGGYFITDISDPNVLKVRLYKIGSSSVDITGFIRGRK